MESKQFSIDPPPKEKSALYTQLWMAPKFSVILIFTAIFLKTLFLGQMNQSIADMENALDPVSEEEHLKEIWRELGVGQNGHLTLPELATVCQHIGMDEMNTEVGIYEWGDGVYPSSLTHWKMCNPSLFSCLKITPFFVAKH